MELPKARESKAAIAAAMKASFATEHQKREIRGGLEADMKEFKKEIVRMVRRSRSGNHRTDFNDVKRNNNRKSFIQKIFFFSLVDICKLHHTGLLIGIIVLRAA